MAYNDTPLPTETPSQSQPLMRQNFNQIATSYNTDHIALSSGTNVGQHKQVTFANVLAGDPGLAAPVSSLYTKGTPPQLFFQNGALAANVMQLTGNAVLTGSEYNIVTPWGLILKLGQGTASNAGDTNNFATPFPNSAIGLILTPRHAGALSSAFTGLSTTQFIGWLQAGPGSQVIFYLAWGT